MATNWRYKNLEVDIIAKTESSIVFIEVKTRSSNEFGEPETFVSLKKQKLIIKAANQYIIENNITADARFDIVSVSLKNSQTSVKHIIDAFYPIVK